MAYNRNYLQEAEVNGWLIEHPSGPIVASIVSEDSDDQTVVYVDALPDDIDLESDELLEVCDRHFGRVDSLLVRTRTLAGSAEVTLVHFAPEQSLGHYASLQPRSDFSIRPSNQQDSTGIRERLVEAFRRGHGESFRLNEVEAEVDRVFAESGFKGFVLEIDGLMAGHVSIVSDCVDEQSGDSYTELVDTFVDDSVDRSIIDYLARRAILEARRVVQPLRATVVHPLEQKAQAILSGLIARGWTLDHRVVRLERR